MISCEGVTSAHSIATLGGASGMQRCWLRRPPVRELDDRLLVKSGKSVSVDLGVVATLFTFLFGGSGHQE